MCQIIVILDDVADRPGAYRAGEVVTIVEDDHAFSPLELAHPRWRIVRVPGLPASAIRPLAIADRASRGAYRRAQCAGRVGVEFLRATNGPITLAPRQAFELLTAFGVRHGD